MHLFGADAELIAAVRTALAARLPDVVVGADDLDGARTGGVVVVEKSAKPPASAEGLARIPHLMFSGPGDVETILDATAAAFHEPVRLA